MGILGSLLTRRGRLVRTLEKGKDYEVRGKAAEALGKIGNPRDVEPLIHALRNDGSAAAADAATALSKMGPPAVEPLIGVLRDEDGSSWKRELAAGALGRIGDLRAIEPLLEALKGATRLTASAALARLGDKRALEPLVVALQDKDVSDRRLAAEALGVLGDESAVEPLILALNDEDSPMVGKSVRQLAAEAIEKIGGNRGAKEVKAMRAREKREKEEGDKEERRMEQETAREESRIDETCRELLRLLRMNSSYNGGPGFREPGTLTEIRSIGERLDGAGGMSLMRKVAYKVQARDELAASWLDGAWDGIGYWRG